MAKFLLFIFIIRVCLIKCEKDFDRDPGKALGYFAECPGSEKPAVVTESYLNKHMPITFLTRLPSGKIYRKRHAYPVAAKYLSADPNVDFNKKTALWITGWVDRSDLIVTETIATTLLKKDFNVLVVDTHFFTRFAYPIASRLSPIVGNVTANFLSKIGTLDPQKVYMFGFSLGGQTVGFVGKFYEQFTGRKFRQIFAVDPSGPCFRRRSPEHRLAPGDAELVQVLHTNSEEMGIATPMGDIDWYANGGEFQFGMMRQVPCLGFCSHFRALFMLHSMITYEKHFYGVRCKNVQQARESKCYENSPMVLNIMSLSKVDRTKRGVYYLPTTNQWPFFLGREKVKNKYDHGKEGLRSLNLEDTLILNEEYLEKAEKIFHL